MRIILAVALVFSLAGCASQIMQGYVGKDIREVALDYGPPTSVIDLPGGQRAFQWSMNSTGYVPQTTNMQVSAYGSSAYGTSTTYGGYTYNQSCLYTLIGEPNADRSFTVVSFRTPSMMCE